MPADIKYPTDSGLLTKGITRIATVVARLHAAGIAPRTEFDDQTALARQSAHRIGSKLRRRTDDAKAEVLVITGELADLAEVAVEQARRVLVNAQRMAERPVRRKRRIYELEAGMPPDAPRLAPAISQAITATGVVPDAVTGDRGYGQTSVDEALAEFGVELVAILRKGQPGKARQQVEAADSFVELVKWRTGAEAESPR